MDPDRVDWVTTSSLQAAIACATTCVRLNLEEALFLSGQIRCLSVLSAEEQEPGERGGEEEGPSPQYDHPDHHGIQTTSVAPLTSTLSRPRPVPDPPLPPLRVLSPGRLYTWALHHNEDGPRLGYLVVAGTILRHRGWGLRPGYGFGSDFMVYARHPSQCHAEFACLVCPEDSRGEPVVAWDGCGVGYVSPAHLHAHVRVAHSVRKRLLMLRVLATGPNEVDPGYPPVAEAKDYRPEGEGREAEAVNRGPDIEHVDRREAEAHYRVPVWDPRWLRDVEIRERTLEHIMPAPGVYLA